MPKQGRTAVYWLYDAKEQLLYVGMTSNPDSRFGQHSVKKPWWPSVTQRVVKWYPTREKAAAAERSAIFDESPRWNVHLRDSRSLPRPEVPSDPAEQAALFARFKKAREVRKATEPAMKAAAIKALRHGATTQQLAKLTGLTPQFFSALARSAGIELPRGPRKR